MGNKTRVVLIDDHPLFREGVVQSLNRDPSIQVVAEGMSLADAERLVRSLTPNVLLLDIAIPGGGLQAAQSISLLSPDTRIIMLTGSERPEDLMAALKAGASGYVLKGVSARELVGIIRTVMAGEVYVTPALAGGMLVRITRSETAGRQQTNLIAELTERELEILHLVASGCSNREIGLQLHLSEKTIKHYMTYIMQKLQVRNRVEAAMYIQRQGEAQGTAAPAR